VELGAVVEGAGVNREKPPSQVLLVSWLDTWSDSRWASYAKARKTQPQPCQSVGFLVCQDDKRIVLAPTISQDECDRLVIPMGAVTDIRELVESKRGT